MFSARARAGLAGLILLLGTSLASAQGATPTLSAAVEGSAVTLTWTPVDGATDYVMQVLPQGGTLLAVQTGNTTTVTVPGVPFGTYFARVAGIVGGLPGPPSNVVTIVVSAPPPPPPPAPTNLAAAVNNNSVLLTWDLANPSALSALAIQAGTTQGGADLGTLPVRVSTSSFLASVPNGTYFLRIFAFGAGGLSPASNELTLAVPACQPPAVIPFSVSSQGSFIQASWPQIPGALGYRIDASSAPGGGAELGSIPFGPTQTSFSLFGVPTGTYYLTLHTTLSCGASASSAVQVLDVTAPVRLPAKSLSHATSLVHAAATSTGGVGSSCGNNTWLFNVLRKLRIQDDRFGNNWKRGNFGDMSQDVILYNFSDLPNEQADAPQVYGWDVIGAHCGPNPSPQASVLPEGAPGTAGWTIRNYLQAGFNP